MMKKWWILMSVLCMSFSCSNDEVNDPEDDALAGEWILSNISCFCFFEEGTDFSTTRLIFDTNENKVTVQNSGQDTYFKQSGTYSYSGEGNRLQFSDNEAYNFTVKGTSSLQLVFEDNPNLSDDEVTYSFRR
jgi:hypothetical protein